MVREAEISTRDKLLGLSDQAIQFVVNQAWTDPEDEAQISGIQVPKCASCKLIGLLLV